MKSDSALPEIEGIEIIEPLGQGGMSVVYKAVQKSINRTVALKLLQKTHDESSIKRFQVEAKNTSKLKHPNIVGIMTFGISKDFKPFIVMEYLDGITLATYLKEKRLTLGQFKQVFLPVLSALSYAHENGLIHRDLKPANIMLKCNAADVIEQVKVVDFGIAKNFLTDGTASGLLTKAGGVIGTPSYMSPEQCRGEDLDQRSDLYSLACIMYESLVGTVPYFGSSSLEIMQQHASNSAITASDLINRIDIKNELAKTIAHALSKDPSKRFQSAAEMQEQLELALDSENTQRVPKLVNTSKIELSPKQLVFVWLAIAIAAIALTLYINKNARTSAEKFPVISKKSKTIHPFDKPLSSAELEQVAQDRSVTDELRSKALLKKADMEQSADAGQALVDVDRALKFAGRSEAVFATELKAEILCSLPGKLDEGIECWNRALKMRLHRYQTKPKVNAYVLCEDRTKMSDAYAKKGDKAKQLELLKDAVYMQTPTGPVPADSDGTDWNKLWRSKHLIAVEKLANLYADLKMPTDRNKLLTTEIADVENQKFGVSNVFSAELRKLRDLLELNK